LELSKNPPVLGCPVDLLLHKYAESTGRKGLGIADDHDKSPPIKQGHLGRKV